MGDWQAVAIEGPEAAARAFVLGFLTGRGIDPATAVFHEELGRDHPAFADRLRELFGLGGRHVVLLPPAAAAALIGALRAGAHAELQAAAEGRVVRSGSFTFRAETPSPEAAATIRSVLVVDLPPGITLADVREEGMVDPEQRGVELYAPAPEFTYRAAGTLAGRLPEIARLRRRAAALDFVVVEPLRIEMRDRSGAVRPGCRAKRRPEAE